MAVKRSTKVTLTLSIREWIDVRRFLRRAELCSQGECPAYGVQASYLVGPLVDKINTAIASVKNR